MRSVDIDNIRQFTTQLFTGEAFDRFLAVEAEFSVATTFTIDGHINAGFVGEEDMQLPQYREGIVAWGRIRPVCFEIIKGRKVPRQFRIIFKMPASFQQRFLQESGLRIPADQIGGLYMNLNFKDGRLTCTTGSSMKTFSLDKSLEIQWDEYVSRFLKTI